MPPLIQVFKCFQASAVEPVATPTKWCHNVLYTPCRTPVHHWSNTVDVKPPEVSKNKIISWRLLLRWLIICSPFMSFPWVWCWIKVKTKCGCKRDVIVLATSEVCHSPIERCICSGSGSLQWGRGKPLLPLGADQTQSSTCPTLQNWPPRRLPASVYLSTDCKKKDGFSIHSW